MSLVIIISMAISFYTYKLLTSAGIYVLLNFTLLLWSIITLNDLLKIKYVKEKDIIIAARCNVFNLTVLSCIIAVVCRLLYA